MPFTVRSIAATLPTLLVMLVFMVPSAQGQRPDDDWQVIFAPYALFANIEGNAAVGQSGPVPIDVGFGQILENLQIGAMLHGEVRKGAWGVVLDFAFMNLGTSASIPSGAVVLDADVDELVFEAYLSYRKQLKKGWIEGYGGIRFWDLDINLGLRTPLFEGAVQRGENWTDPVIGTRVRHNFTDKAFLIANGDIGGFGVNSDFSWNLQGGLGYEFSERFALVFQYRVLNVDFDNGKDGTPNFFAYDTETHGPLIGFVFRY